MPEKQRFLTIGEAAEFLHVSEVSLRRWTNSGKLRCFRVGGRGERRFLVEDLIAFMPSTTMPSTTTTSPHRVPQPDGVEDDSNAHERHISLFFRDPDEQWQMMRSYLLEYLTTGAPVIYLQHSTPSERLMERLHAEGLPLEDLIARGLLRVLPPDQSYLLAGRFDAQRMLAFVEASIVSALETGHKRILLTGEMTWSLSGAPGSDQMMTYEALLNPLVDKYPGVIIICQYNLKRFDGASILEALLTHPSVHVPSGRVPGFYGL
jgi:excisionase family DNA binding protein